MYDLGDTFDANCSVLPGGSLVHRGDRFGAAVGYIGLS